MSLYPSRCAWEPLSLRCCKWGAWSSDEISDDSRLYVSLHRTTANLLLLSKDDEFNSFYFLQHIVQF
jgi:hypothetical protein